MPSKVRNLPGRDRKSVQWFKILVTGRNGDHEKVKITLPVSLWK